MKNKIIFFGPPGSGKGVQSKLLSQTLKIPTISSGDCIRDLLASNNSKYSHLITSINNGDFIPDSDIFEIISLKLNSLNLLNGFIADGFPRTAAQAKQFQVSNFLPIESSICVILEVNEDILVQRIVTRSTIENRSDDTVKIFRKRYSLYLEHLADISKFYDNTIYIDANCTIEEISHNIDLSIKKIT